MKIIYLILCFTLTFWILILVTNSKILVGEIKVEPGESYYLESYGNLGEAEQASLVCSYFNGFKIIKDVFWYSPNNFFGINNCLFIDKN